jgi:hypothetical protein
MKLKLCSNCKRPYLANKDFCPKCPKIEWNQESWMNVGCLLAMVSPLFIMIFLWLLFFFGLFFR